MSDKINITVDDVEYEVQRHRNVLDALLEIGVASPHFCYHEGLEAAGNCRICYVNLADPRSGECSPRLFTSCTQPLAPDMKLWTDTDAVKKGRETVMEFLLINHPLDCPVCDKAGECTLQDYTFEHARSKSRFAEHKNVYPVRDLGPTLKLWQTRCIICTRCVRFLEEVTGTSELTVVNRSDRCEIDTFPGIPVDNPMMGNLVDICPVGAIIDKDFLFQARVWSLEKCNTVSPDSALGCNVTLEHVQGDVKRIRPRRNDEVNGFWIADEERYNYRYIHDESRLLGCKVGEKNASVSEAITAAVQKLAKHGDAGSLAAITSAWATLEELDLFRQIADSLAVTDTAFLARPVVDDVKFPGWTIYGDKNPNRAGVELILGEGCTEAGVEAIARKIEKGEIKGLLVVNGVPQKGILEYGLPGKLVSVLSKLDDLIVLDFMDGPLTQAASVVLAGSCYAEKSGAWINNGDRVQLVGKAIECPGRALEDAVLLQRILREAKGHRPSAIGDRRESDREPRAESREPGGERPIRSAAELFADLAARTPALEGLTHWKIRRTGKLLKATAAVGDD